MGGEFFEISMLEHLVHAPLTATIVTQRAHARIIRGLSHKPIHCLEGTGPMERFCFRGKFPGSREVREERKKQPPYFLQRREGPLP